MPDAPRQADSDASLAERVEALERSGEGLHERFDALEGGFFKFSVEQGWMRPAVRVGSGTAFGALLGALGTQGAPFLLYTASGSVPGLVGYTGLVLAGGAAVYFFEGWRALLYNVAVAGWATFAFVYFNLPGRGALVPRATAARTALQGGIVFAWLLFWGVPVLREVLQVRRPARWGTLERESPSSLIGASSFSPARAHAGVQLAARGAGLFAPALGGIC
jgi:uncharacterized membrane protein